MNDLMLETLDPGRAEALDVLQRLARTGSSLAGSPVSPADATATAALYPLPLALPCTALPRVWSESTLRELLDLLPDALVAVNGDGIIVLVNVQAEELFGYRREELLGHAVEVLVPERYRLAHAGQRTAYVADPRVRPMGARLELSGLRRDGTEFPVEISLRPLRTEHGLLIASVIRDVSQRKREEAKFRTLVENIPAVTFIAPLDDSAPEFYVSPQIEHLLGFSQREWLEDPVLWHRQLHPDDRDRWNVEFAPTCATGSPFRSVYRFLAKDGHVVWVLGSAQMVRGGDGQPLFLQGIAFDVSTVKEAEEALRDLNAELEERVHQRTQELTHFTAVLQEKTEELEQFAYVAAHDLKEPLRTLVNYPQRLLKHYGDRFDGQAGDWINRVISGAERMRHLIDSLSLYSRAVRRDRVLAPVDCAAVLGEACANLQASLEESKAELALGELPTVAGNHQQLMLLFQNLVGNALKFRDPGRPVRVEVGSRRHEGGWLCWVRDNGIGIEAKFLRRVFGLGERLHSASRYPGTGFGLAICEKIVVGHGGRIWVESEPGQGSTFSFTLPGTGAMGAPAG